MADEPKNTEPEQENPATAYQPPASVVTVYDADGREHFASASSKFVVDGLADGSLTTEPRAKTEEVPGGAETGSAGDDPEPGTADGNDGSENGPADTGGTGRRRRTGTA